MKKLKLNLEELQVQSFDTTPRMEGRPGTVRALSDTVDAPECRSEITACGATCDGCGGTDASVCACYTDNVNVATCAATCTGGGPHNTDLCTFAHTCGGNQTCQPAVCTGTTCTAGWSVLATCPYNMDETGCGYNTCNGAETCDNCIPTVAC